MIHLMGKLFIIATHPQGITVKIVGIQSNVQGIKCREHEICGLIVVEDVFVRFHKVTVIVAY